jgi:hypothetical protein
LSGRLFASLFQQQGHGTTAQPDPALMARWRAMEPTSGPDKAWVQRSVAMLGAFVAGGLVGDDEAGEGEGGAAAARLRPSRALDSLERLAADPIVTGRWRAPHREAFQCLRDAVVRAAARGGGCGGAGVDPSLPLFIRVDASSTGWAVHAVQYRPLDGVAVPVAHFASRFSGTQLAWEVNVREAYALVAAVRLLRRLLLTVPSWCLQTDHRNLAGMASSTHPAIRRWFVELRTAGVAAQAWPGRANVAADAGSRDPMSTSAVPVLPLVPKRQ